MSNLSPLRSSPASAFASAPFRGGEPPMVSLPEALLGMKTYDPATFEAAARALAGLTDAQTVVPTQAWLDLGAWLFDRRAFVQAEYAYRCLLVRLPRHASALGNLGLVLARQQRLDEAEAVLNSALAIDPEAVNARNSLGVLLWTRGRLPEAEAAYREVIAREPDRASAYSNLGLVLKEMNRLPEAEAACRTALALDQSIPETHNNLGTILWQQGRVRESADAYERALTLRPDYAGARSNLALPLLALGDFRRAWPLYESRMHPSIPQIGLPMPAVPYPLWRGESLAGKSLLIWPEQGHGDSLQFCRYASLLKARGAARVSIACAPALARLFNSLDGVDEVIALDGEGTIAPHDYWCLAMSLPLCFGTTLDTIPANVPYLHADPALVDAWRARLPAGDFRVGIVWAGDPRADQAGSHAIDRRRSLHVSALVPLLHTAGVSFVSLQLGAATRPQLRELPPSVQVVDPMGDVRDFADTAAIVAQLDLVIAVDTSVAHLAGALGKPVWIMSRYAACWRWLIDRDDSPWYPDVRLFRQTQAGDWGDVLARVGAALADAVRARRGSR